MASPLNVEMSPRRADMLPGETAPARRDICIKDSTRAHGLQSAALCKLDCSAQLAATGFERAVDLALHIALGHIVAACRRASFRDPAKQQLDASVVIK